MKEFIRAWIHNFNFRNVSKKRLKFESVIFISATKFVYFKTKISQYQTSPPFGWQKFTITKDICKFCDWELNFKKHGWKLYPNPLSFSFLFQISTVKLILEQEGSSSSPATVSKLPGTSYSSTISSPSPATSSKSITELSGQAGGGLFDGGFDGMSSTTHVSTKMAECTKRTKTTVIHTKDGPVEKREEVVEGGPECQTFTDFSKGELSSLFPTLTQASSSSSSSSSSSFSSINTGGAKGSLLGSSKAVLVDPFDFGAFTTANADDDLPDLHARSVKSTHVKRKADYVGKGTQPSSLH